MTTPAPPTNAGWRDALALASGVVLALLVIATLLYGPGHVRGQERILAAGAGEE